MEIHTYKRLITERLLSLSKDRRSPFGLSVHKNIRVPLIIALCICLFGILFLELYKLNLSAKKESLPERTSSQNASSLSDHSEGAMLFVEISGAISKPDVYKVGQKTRLYELIRMAGGLTDSADSAFFARNFNLAALLFDQEKVHVPNLWEVRNQLYLEKQKFVSAYIEGIVSQSNPSQTTSSNNANRKKISLNNASPLEIETLKGVGKITAARITSSRPYESLNDLITKGIVKQSLFQSIESDIEL